RQDRRCLYAQAAGGLHVRARLRLLLSAGLRRKGDRSPLGRRRELLLAGGPSAHGPRARAVGLRRGAARVRPDGRRGQGRGPMRRDAKKQETGNGRRAKGNDRRSLEGGFTLLEVMVA